MSPERVISGVQVDYLRSVESPHIPSGAIIPDNCIQTYIPFGSSIVDFGGGTGKKALHLETLGYRLSVFDVNPHAIATAQHVGISAIEVDVSNTAAVKRVVNEQHIHPDAVIMEALLCNMVEPKRPQLYLEGLKSAAQILPKGGRILIADVLATDDVNPVLEQSMKDYELVKLRELWNKRYINNEHIGLPRHVFIVAKPGWLKELMEYGPTSDLWELLRRNEVERFARHFTNADLEQGLASVGFRQVSWEYAIWQSRSGRPLSGCVIVGEKE